MALHQKLRNKRIVITGASMGIGKAVALELAQEGASLVVNSRGANQADANLLEQLTQHIITMDGVADYSYGDISDFDYAGKLIQLCCDRFGGIDGLINLAPPFATITGSKTIFEILIFFNAAATDAITLDE